MACMSYSPSQKAKKQSECHCTHPQSHDSYLQDIICIQSTYGICSNLPLTHAHCQVIGRYSFVWKKKCKANMIAPQQLQLPNLHITMQKISPSSHCGLIEQRQLWLHIASYQQKLLSCILFIKIWNLGMGWQLLRMGNGISLLFEQWSMTGNSHGYHDVTQFVARAGWATSNMLTISNSNSY